MPKLDRDTIEEFTIQEVADKKRVSFNTVSNWLNRKKNPLTCFRDGQIVRITRAQLDEFNARCSTAKKSKKRGAK